MNIPTTATTAATPPRDLSPPEPTHDLDATARNALARILLQQGNSAQSAILYRRVLELDPKNAEARAGLTTTGKTP